VVGLVDHAAKRTGGLLRPVRRNVEHPPFAVRDRELEQTVAETDPGERELLTSDVFPTPSGPTSINGSPSAQSTGPPAPDSRHRLAGPR
jgi:hypothetical protein